MTVSSSVNRNDYAGNGSTTSFAVSFRFLQNSDVKATLRDALSTETLQVETTDYTLTGAGGAGGGTLVMIVAPPSGTTLTIQRDVPATQETDYVENDEFPAESHEDALDKLTMLVQQQGEDSTRHIGFSDTVSDATGPAVELSQDATQRADTFLGFDALGNIVTKTASVAGLVDQGQQDKRYGPIFATVAAMTAANPVSIDGVVVTLVAGMTVYLQGWTTAGDGGRKELLMVASQAADEFGDHTAANGTVGVFQSKGEALAEQLGFKSDGSDESSVFAGLGTYLATYPTTFITFQNGRTYRAEAGTKTLLNNVRGNGATILVKNGSNFSKLGISDFYLRDINFITIGSKSDPSATTGSDLYDTSENLENGTVDIDGMTHTALTTEGDSTSWSDDTLKTRFKRSIRFITDNSAIKNCTSFGVASFLLVEVKTDGIADHEEENIHCYNCETAVYLRSPSEDTIRWRSGSSTNIRLTNTSAQQGYWIGQDVGVLNNGKDCMLIECDHLFQHSIDGVIAHRAIERSVYSQSGNTFMRNTRDENSVSGGAMMKYDGGVTGATRARNTSSNIEVNGNLASSIDLQVYGQDAATIKDWTYRNNDQSNARKVISLSRHNQFVNIRDGYADNAAIGIQIANVENATFGHRDIHFDSIEFKNVISGSASNYSLFGLVNAIGTYTFPTATNLKMTDIFSDVEDGITYTDVNANALNLWKIDGILLDNVTAHFQTRPFDTTDSVDVRVLNSEFIVHTNQAIQVVWNRLDNDEVKANVFDFTVKTSKDAAGVGEYDFHFKKLEDSGMVRCAAHLESHSYNYVLPDNTNLQVPVPFDESFKISISYNDSYAEFVYDVATNTLTTIVNSGTEISTSDQTTKVRVYYDAGGDRVNVRRSSTVLTGGPLRWKVTKS